jgi:hypothetical protein
VGWEEVGYREHCKSHDETQVHVCVHSRLKLNTVACLSIKKPDTALGYRSVLAMSPWIGQASLGGMFWRRVRKPGGNTSF